MAEDKNIITDWKGNEVKAGMTIYFVQTKPGLLESSRFGVCFPDRDGKSHSVWEPEENWLERKNKEMWELGEEYLVEEKNGILYYTTTPDRDGYTYSAPFSMASLFGSAPTIAIKGISDAQP